MTWTWQFKKQTSTKITLKLLSRGFCLSEIQVYIFLNVYFLWYNVQVTKWRFFSSKNKSSWVRNTGFFFSTRIPVDYDGALNFYLSFLTRHIGYKVSFYNKVVVPFGYGNKRSLSVFPFKCVYSRFGFPWGTAWSLSIMLTKVRNDWYIILPIIKHVRTSCSLLVLGFHLLEEQIRCFDTVFRRPFRCFSITLKVILSLSDRDYELKFVKMQLLVKSISLWQ